MKRHRVKPVAKFAPFEEGEHSTIMAAMRGQGKMDSVVNNRPRIKTGIADRARLHGLPTNSKAPYGFRFVSEFRKTAKGDRRFPIRLEPDPSTYPVACYIWDLTRGGSASRQIFGDRPWALRGICRALVDPIGPLGGVLAPRGGAHWGTETVRNILKNPVYYGVHHALRHEACEPGKRTKPGYGKSSSRMTAPESWQPLPDFTVEGPIITREEYEQVQEKLVSNKQNSRRNAKRLYLLSGMLYSPACGGRLYPQGQRARSDYYYVCRRYGQRAVGIDPCDCPKLYGPTVERQVWEAVTGFLKTPERFMEARKRRQGGDKKITETIWDLNRQIRRLTGQEMKLMDEEFRGRYSPDAIAHKATDLHGQRAALEAGLAREEAALATVRQAKSGFEALAIMQEKMLDRLDSATPDRQRWILESLDTRVEVKPEGKLLDLGVPKYILDAVVSDQKGQI